MPPKPLSVKVVSNHHHDLGVNVSWQYNGNGGEPIDKVWLTYLNMKHALEPQRSHWEVPISFSAQQVRQCLNCSSNSQDILNSVLTVPHPRTSC